MDKLFTIDFIDQKKVVPIDLDKSPVIMACLEMDYNLKDDLEYILGQEVSLVPMDLEKFLKYKELYLNSWNSKESRIKSILNEIDKFQKVEDEDFNINVESSPIVRLLDEIIDYAIENKCSDIHIEGMETKLRVRMRHNGTLFTYLNLPLHIQSELITRIKILSLLDIAERRKPQDGRFTYNYGDNHVDLRVSIMPTVYGEKVVMRLLDPLGLDYTPKGIGLSDEDFALMEKLLIQPQGLILLCGPTGSGKTSTLYTMIQLLNHETRNILTIEDPVEFKINGVNQIQVNDKAGLSFENGLKTMLRQDPEVMMIGEIRSVDTAEIALRSSITGHLVLSTLHTNDSPSAIIRLMDMNIEPYLISAGTIGILSQRLVRTLCPECKEKKLITDSKFQLDNVMTYRAVGCSNCYQGYVKRKAIFEILILTEEIRTFIKPGITLSTLKKLAKQSGMIPLKEKLRTLIIDGTISLEEAYRVINTI